MPIGYPGNSTSKEARAKAGGGFESAIENYSEWVEGVPPEIQSVSGSFVEGQQATIEVNNLSANRSGQLYFENFSALSVGQDPATLRPEIYTEQLHGGSDDRPIFGPVFARESAIQRDLSHIWIDLGGLHKEIYTEVWLRLNYVDFDSGGDAQIKYPRLSPSLVNADAQNTNPVFSLINQANEGAIRVTGSPGVLNFNESGTPFISSPFGSVVNDAWFKLVYYMKLNDPGVANGERYLKTSYADGAGNSNYSAGVHFASPFGAVPIEEWRGERVEFDLASMTDDPGFRSFLSTPYFQRSDQTTISDTARQFINDSPERVMVGDAPTWLGCDQFKAFTLKTISREAGQIIVDVDSLGPLGTGPVYLYVFNRDGQYNANGYEWRSN